MSSLKEYTLEAFVLWFGIAGSMHIYIDGKFKRISKRKFELLPNNIQFEVEGNRFVKTGNMVKGV